jgi:hypothetical protein
MGMRTITISKLKYAANLSGNLDLLSMVKTAETNTLLKAVILLETIPTGKQEFPQVIGLSIIRRLPALAEASFGQSMANFLALVMVENSQFLVSGQG